MRSLAVTFLVALASGCSLSRTGGPDRGSCEFVVFNRTSHALDVRRMRDTLGYTATLTLGTLDPGERLSDTAPCAQGAVWIRGYAVPAATWLRPEFPFVDGWSDLTPGSKASISLHWP